MNTFFVTGTDTGVGKTLASCALLHAGNKLGFSTLGLKPLAAGCEETPQGLRNEDALALQESSSIKLAYDQVNPVALKQALAPHIAAANEGKRLSVDRLVGYLRGAFSHKGTSHKAGLCVIEGAGGWRVPLNQVERMSAIPKELNIPVILVVGVRLGCINHALLTAEAIVRDGLQVAGWIGSVVDPKMPAQDDNINTLKSLLPFPCLGCIPWLGAEPSPELASKDMTVDPLMVFGK